MQIGIAVSGSGGSALNAHILLEELEASGIQIAMVSACSAAALPAMLWAYGLPSCEIPQLLSIWNRTADTEDTVKQVCRKYFAGKTPACRIALNSVDIRSGKTVLFSDDLEPADAQTMEIFPLAGNEPAALLSAIAPDRQLQTVRFGGYDLCDFSLRYGSPFFPLKMMGMERILSVSFSGSSAPSRLAADSLSALTGKRADLFYSIECPLQESPRKIRRLVQDKLGELCSGLYF